MVGSLLILKLLQCKRNHLKCHKSSSPSRANDDRGARNSQGGNFSGSRVKREDSQFTCRVCLKEGNVPIFVDDDDDDDTPASRELCESINAIGAIEVRADDPYPKYLCKPCYTLLQSAILFRKTAQETNEILTKPQNLKDVVSDDDMYFASDGEERLARGADHTCRRCDLQFSSFQEYNDHMLTGEHETKRITCKICNKTYASQYFRQHMEFHRKPCVCDICGKKFMKVHFQKHRLIHFHDLPYQCELCPYRGRFPESLKMHMRSHTGEKPYQCAQCPSRFISKSNLNKHMFTHKGEHDFRCEVCGRGFYTKRELELHTKVDHLGVKEHVCGTCGKAFGYRKQMRKHELKVHHRKKLKSGKQAIWRKVESMKQQGIEHIDGPSAMG